MLGSNQIIGIQVPVRGLNLYGPGAMLKVSDNAPADFARIFSNRNQGGKVLWNSDDDSPPVVVEGLLFDGNKADKKACNILGVVGEARATVRVTNCYFSVVHDHLTNQALGAVNRVTGVFVRRDLTNSQNDECVFSGCRFDSSLDVGIDIEGSGKNVIENCNLYAKDLAVNAPTGSRSPLYLMFRDNDISSDVGIRNRSWSDHPDTLFHLSRNQFTGTSLIDTILSGGSGAPAKASFFNCSFDIDSDVVIAGVTGFAIEGHRKAGNVQEVAVSIDHCTFDTRLFGSINACGNGKFSELVSIRRS